MIGNYETEQEENYRKQSDQFIASGEEVLGKSESQMAFYQLPR